MSQDTRKHLICFLIFWVVYGLLFASLSVSPSLSEPSNGYEKIVLVGEAILLKENYVPIYINVSADICRGPITIRFDNSSYYSYGYECIQSLEKPYMDIKHSMYHHLNVTIHTLSYIGVIIKIPVKVIVEIINKTDNYTLIKFSLRFTHTRYLDIIPKEAILYNPRYVLLNNRTFSINESAEWIHNLTYTIKLLNYNNNAYINNI